MAVRVHVLRTCDRCGRPIETNGTVPVQQLKEGDRIPVFQRTVLRVTREEPAQDGGAPHIETLGTFTDICDPCTNVINRAIDTLLKRTTDEDEAPTNGKPAVGGEPAVRRARAGRAPRTVASNMPGPDGVMSPGAAGGAAVATPATSEAAVVTAGTPEASSDGDEEFKDEPF